MSTAAKSLAALLLLVMGAWAGHWLTEEHFQPLLDSAKSELKTVTTARDNLVALTGEQGRKLGELVQAAELRERNAAQALADAQEVAKSAYAEANRLMQERTGGDPAGAANAIIDQELGL